MTAKGWKAIMCRLIMWLCHAMYKKDSMPILCIKGTEKDYPRYLLYTEDEHVYQRMDEFWNSKYKEPEKEGE